MSQDILEKANRIKTKHYEKNSEELRSRVKSESKDTLAYISRQRAKGKADREIIRDLTGSKI